MKKILLGLMAMVACSVFANTEVVDGYTWTYHYNGEAEAHVSSVSPKSGNIVVPSMLDGKRVTEISRSTFAHGTEIRSVVVPSGVTRIDESAFYNCSGLQALHLPSSLTHIIGSMVFTGCENIQEATLPGTIRIDINGSSRTEVYCPPYFPSASTVKILTIPDGTKKLGGGVFAQFVNVETVNIPSSASEIEVGAFAKCYNLRSVVFAGDAPRCLYPIFDLACNDLVIYVPKGSKGWDGNPDSTKLPKLWPHNNSAGRPIMHIGDPLPKPEPLICTNYVFETITNHVYHHDVVTDLTAYHTTVTNVYVHYVNENAKPTFIFPSEYDTGFVNVVAEIEGGYAVIPATWSVNYPGFTEKYGNDFSKALSKHNGKFDQRGNPMYVWQDYVAGTNPMDINDVFHATIAIEDGQVVVSHSPVLDEARAALRKYTVYGKKNLMDSEWKEVEPGEELDYNFYRVTVRMK